MFHIPLVSVKFPVHLPNWLANAKSNPSSARGEMSCTLIGIPELELLIGTVMAATEETFTIEV